MAAIYISKKVRNIILIGVTLFSIIIGISKSNILKTFISKPSTAVHRKTKADKIFASSDYETNINLVYQIKETEKTNNFAKADKQIRNIIDKYQLGTRFNKHSASYSDYILEIPKDKYDEVLNELTTNPKPASQELVTNSGTDTKNLEKEVENLKETEKVYLRQYKNERLTPRQIREIQVNISLVGSKIDSLQKIIQERNRRRDFVLARIQMTKLLQPSSMRGQLTRFKSFLGWTAVSFIISLIALTAMYGIYIIMDKLLVTAGVKTKVSASRYGYKYGKYGYGGYSGYGNYDYGSSGYGEKKRKVIKKYIRKDAKPEEDEGEEEKNNVDKENR